jgi:hypothetical protein
MNGLLLIEWAVLMGEAVQLDSSRDMVMLGVSIGAIVLVGILWLIFYLKFKDDAKPANGATNAQKETTPSEEPRNETADEEGNYGGWKNEASEVADTPVSDPEA